VCESTDQVRKRPTVFGRIDSVICAVIAVQVASPGASVTRRVGALRMMHRFSRNVYVATFKSNFGANSLMRLKICFYLCVTCTNSSTSQILITSDLERMAR
jgi:hypothetical protein